MTNIVSENLWVQIGQKSKVAKFRCAAVAYVTSEVHVTFRKGDVLVVDASDHAVSNGQTDRGLLSKLLKRGVRIYSLPGLHAKIMVLNRFAIIGSANLSKRSERLTEAAVVTNNKALVTEARALVLRLANDADEVDIRFIEHLCTLTVRKPKPPPLVRPPNSLQRVWLLGVRELDDDAFPGEKRAAAAGSERAEKLTEAGEEVEWIRYPRGSTKSKFIKEAKNGDRIIEIWHRQNGTVEVFGGVHIRLI